MAAASRGAKTFDAFGPRFDLDLTCFVGLIVYFVGWIKIAHSGIPVKWLGSQFTALMAKKNLCMTVVNEYVKVHCTTQAKNPPSVSFLCQGGGGRGAAHSRLRRLLWKLKRRPGSRRCAALSVKRTSHGPWWMRWRRAVQGVLAEACIWCKTCSTGLDTDQVKPF